MSSKTYKVDEFFEDSSFEEYDEFRDTIESIGDRLYYIDAYFEMAGEYFEEIIASIRDSIRESSREAEISSKQNYQHFQRGFVIEHNNRCYIKAIGYEDSG